MAKFRQNQESWAADWDQAFREHGRNAAAAASLTREAVQWATNNPDMPWQDIFDAVLLSDEVDDG